MLELYLGKHWNLHFWRQILNILTCALIWQCQTPEHGWTPHWDGYAGQDQRRPVWGWGCSSEVVEFGFNMDCGFQRTGENQAAYKRESKTMKDLVSLILVLSRWNKNLINDLNPDKQHTKMNGLTNETSVQLLKSMLQPLVGAPNLRFGT